MNKYVQHGSLMELSGPACSSCRTGRERAQVVARARGGAFVGGAGILALGALPCCDGRESARARGTLPLELLGPARRCRSKKLAMSKSRFK